MKQSQVLSDKQSNVMSVSTSKASLQALAASGIIFTLLSFFLLKDHYSLFGRTQSDNMFVYLAQSFLQGKLNLEFIPTYQDLSSFHNKLYAYWPPLCAFLLMPAVYLHGVYVGDKWFSILFIAMSSFASWLTIDAIGKRAGWIISPFYKALLIIFLSFGTSNIIFAIIGSHWYMAQIAAAMMMSFAIAIALSFKSGYFKCFAMGSFWALALLSRLHLILAAPFFFYIAVCGTPQQANWKEIIKNWKQNLLNLLFLLVPIFLVLIFSAWYNWARFGSIFDNGVIHHNMDLRFRADYQKYGYLSNHYLWHNIYYTLLRLPIFRDQTIFTEPGDMRHWTEGYSIFYQSPVLLYVLLSLKEIKKDKLVSAFWLSIILVSYPILCVMGTGWMQFGARYLFDLFPLLFPLVVIGTRGKISILLVFLVLISIIINLHGLSLLIDVFSHH